MLVATILVPIIAAVLVVLNYALAPRHPQYAKQGVVECGMMTLTNQSRQPYSVVFYVVAALFLAFDLEVVLMWPLAVVLPMIGLYGLWVGAIFFAILTLGFVVELASGALRFSSLGARP